MKIRKLLGAIGLFATLALGSGPALAALAPYLDPIQLLEDNDWETIISIDDNGVATVKAIDANTVIEAGDFFAGIIKIQSTETETGIDVTDLQGTNPTFTSIFLIEATSVVRTPVSATISYDVMNFGAADIDEWDAVYGAGGLIDISNTFDVLSVDGAGTDVSVGTMAMVFNGQLYENALTDDSELTTGTLAESAESFVSGGARLEYEFGFTGTDGVAATDEFWETEGINAAIPSQAGTTTPDNRIALNIVEQWGGPDLAPHNFRFDSLGDGRFTGPTQIQGQGQITGLGAGSPWGVRTDTDFWIAPIPEPTTLTLLSLGLLGMGFAGKRRRNRA